MDIQTLPKDDSSLNLKFTEAEFTSFLGRGAIIDGRNGGVVKCGVGGLPVIMRFRDCYFVQSTVKDGEFVVTRKAFGDHWTRIIALESENEPSSEVLSDLIPVIDATTNPEVLFLFIELGQTVVARRSVTKHLGELIRLNQPELNEG